MEMSGWDLKHDERKRNNIYIVLEEIDFTWDETEVEEFERLWRAGVSLYAMAGIFKRDVDELVLLVMDRKRLGKIEKRSGGYMGNGKEYDGFTSVVDTKKPCACSEEVFQKLTEEGYSTYQIARLMGISRQSLQWQRKKWAQEKVCV
jgi:hypothetical protein